MRREGSSLPAPSSHFLAANGVRLHYLEWGEAGRRPIVLLHGGSAHAHWWDFVAAQLVDRYRCIALDLRGHGDSGWSTALDYRLETHAADVGALIAALQLTDVAVVGHSFGGFVAMRYASQAGARLGALVVVDSRVRIGERSARYLDALRKLPHPVYASIEDAIDRFRLMPNGSAVTRAVLAHVVRQAITPRGDGTWTLKFDRRALAGTPAQDLAPALAAVDCPILVVRGEKSAIVSPASLEEFRTANPRVEFAEIACAHHHVMLDRPAVLADALRRFLERPGDL